MTTYSKAVKTFTWDGETYKLSQADVVEKLKGVEPIPPKPRKYVIKVNDIIYTVGQVVKLITGRKLPHHQQLKLINQILRFGVVEHTGTVPKPIFSTLSDIVTTAPGTKANIL